MTAKLADFLSLSAAREQAFIRAFSDVEADPSVVESWDREQWEVWVAATAAYMTMAVEAMHLAVKAPGVGETSAPQAAEAALQTFLDAAVGEYSLRRSWDLHNPEP